MYQLDREKGSAGMLYREDSQGRIVIGQPTHAWVSGQLARAWGNELFGDVTPWEEVCLGTEQHDVGHAAWEQKPLLNPQTGLPFSFLEMPRFDHLHLWSAAPHLVLPQSRYAALLVSYHGTGLYERYGIKGDTPEVVLAIQVYLEEQYAFQERLLTILRADPYYRTYATAEIILRNRELVRIWDAFSLTICYGRQRMVELGQVPTATGTTTLTLTPVFNDPSRLLVSPWPFRRQSVALVYEGRLLTTTFSDQEIMRQAFQQASWLTLGTTLVQHE